MPIKVRKFNAQVRDSESGQMIPAGLLSSDALEAIEDAKQDAIDAIENKGETTLASIPSDYTALQGEVTDLGQALNDAFYIPAEVNVYNPASEQPNTVIGSDGQETTNNSYTLDTDYIPCVNNQYISLFGGDSTNKDGVAWIAFYTSNKTYIKRVSMQYGEVVNHKCDEPTCAFVRVVIWKGTTNVAVYINNTNPEYTDENFPYVPYGQGGVTLKESSLPDSVIESMDLVEEIDDNIDLSYKYTDITGVAELYTAAYISSSHSITNSSSWGLYIIQISEIPEYSEITVKSYTNVVGRYQVAFYSASTPTDATYISGITFDVASAQNTAVITEIPDNAVSMLISNLTASGSISVVVKSAEELSRIDELSDENNSISALLLRTQRAKFDGQFNYIAYSAMMASGKGPNSEEQYLWGAERKFTAIKGDVRISSDGEIVMCHDEGFTLNGNGEVTAYDANNMTPIRSMTAAECFALVYEGTTDHVCGIDSLVRTCKLYGKIAFITVRSSYLDEIFPKIFECLDRYSMRERAIINGFSISTMKKARKYDQNIMLSWVQNYNHQVTTDDVDTANDLGNCLISCFDYSGSAETKASNQSDVVIAYAKSKDIRLYEAIIGYDIDLNNTVLYDRGFTGAQIAFEPEIFDTFS